MKINIVLMALFAFLVGEVSVLATGITYKIENIGAQIGASGKIRWFFSGYPGDYRQTIPFSYIEKSLTPKQIQWFKDGIKQSPYGSCLGSAFKDLIAHTKPVATAVPNVGSMSTASVVKPIAHVVAPVIGNASCVTRAMKYGSVAAGMAAASYCGLLKYREQMAPEVPKPQNYVQKMQSLVQTHPYWAIGSLGAAIAVSYVAYQNKDKITEFYRNLFGC